MPYYANMRNKTRRLLGLLLIIASTPALSQRAVSPYSIFGNGDVESGRFAQQVGFGGLSTGLRDPLHINVGQPASISALKYTTIDFGGFFQSTSTTDGNVTGQDYHGGFNYLSLAFPIQEWWGMAAGITPYSKVGYSLSSSTSYPSYGDATLEYSGNGGYDRVFLGNAFEVYKGLSVGVNASYYFGAGERITSVLFDDNRFLHTTRVERVAATGFTWDAGLQYVTALNEEGTLELVVGATYSPQGTLNGELNDLYYTFTRNASGADTPRDTVYTVESEPIDVILESNYSIGFTLGGRHEQLIQYAWSVGAEYRMFNLSELNGGTEVRGQFDNGFRAAIGGQLIPYFAFDMDRGSYLSQIDYRLGAHYASSGLELAGEPINDYGLSVGFGFPIGRRVQTPGDIKLATLNFGMILGTRGTTEGGNLQENYSRFVVGLTLSDKWFTQFKYR